MTPIPSFESLGLPSPILINLVLKVFGFWLHWFFMGMWFTGLLVALFLIKSKNTNLYQVGLRLIKTMPIFIAFGINAGIVPLLFIQVLFPNFFYTSTILQAWFWFSVVVLVLIAYYGIYYFIFNHQKPERIVLSYVAGWLSSLIFLFIGLIFSSEMELMVSPALWSNFISFGPGGTIKGTTLAISTQAILRYFLVFGLSTISLSAYILFDNYYIRKENKLAKDVKKLVLSLMIIGIIIFGLSGIKYIGYINPYLKNFIIWKFMPGIAPLLTLSMGFLYYLKPSKSLSLLIFFGALLSLLINSISRQIVQIKELEPFIKLHDLPVRLQISPIMLFLFTFIVGIFVIGYLLKVYFIEGRKNVLQDT